jgi:hypothetical protein
LPSTISIVSLSAITLPFQVAFAIAGFVLAFLPTLFPP